MSQSQSMVPLELSGLDEGRFLEWLSEELENAQSKLCRFVERNGSDAKKAKAKITAIITLCADSPDQEIYSVKTDIKTTLPGRLPAVTVAMGGFGDDRSPRLIVRATGGDDGDDPTQLKLASKDGRPFSVSVEVGNDAADEEVA